MECRWEWADWYAGHESEESADVSEGAPLSNRTAYQKETEQDSHEA